MSLNLDLEMMRLRRSLWPLGQVSSDPSETNQSIFIIYFLTGGLQVGGGITDKNAKDWLDAGAEKVSIVLFGSFFHFPHCLQVIVTSFLFPSCRFSLDRLTELSQSIGKERLVVDVRYTIESSF